MHNLRFTVQALGAARGLPEELQDETWLAGEGTTAVLTSFWLLRFPSNSENQRLMALPMGL